MKLQAKARTVELNQRHLYVNSEMDEMTQRNASLVEETNAAIEQTESQANELDRIVDVFVTDGTSRRSAPAAEAAPAEQPATGIKALQQRLRRLQSHTCQTVMQRLIQM